ncbi:hypothetical protein IWQ55_002752 [Labrenzia sp. EL_208]|nr:hypothetical protein [Labrenzia sp. EL_132]MBG6229539.1 hypothetical protein [Labrenzia sp. EL_208]
MKTIIYDTQQPDMVDMFHVERKNGAKPEPWFQVGTRFRELGIDIVTPGRFSGDMRNVDAVLFQNMPRELIAHRNLPIKRLGKRFFSNSFYYACIRNGLAKRLSVVLYEPEVVLPENYDTDLHKAFATVFTWSVRHLKRGRPYSPLLYLQPVSVDMEDFKAFSERKLLCNFSGNKSSSHPAELYSARVDLIRFMEQHAPEDFDHYGYGWDTSFSSWRGPVRDKLGVMASYRFNLAYENSSREKGYVTEKIFDTLNAKSVPIYWGAEDISDFVPASTYVDRRNFTSNQELLTYLQSMKEDEWQSYLKASDDFLQSPAYRKKFTPNAIVEQLRAGLSM